MVVSQRRNAAMVQASIAQLAGATVPQLQAILQQPNMANHTLTACMAMPRAGLLKGLYAANRWGSLHGCNEVMASSVIAMLAYKQQNPAEAPADIIQWMGSPGDRCAQGPASLLLIFAHGPMLHAETAWRPPTHARATAGGQAMCCTDPRASTWNSASAPVSTGRSRHEAVAMR